MNKKSKNQRRLDIFRLTWQRTIHGTIWKTIGITSVLSLIAGLNGLKSLLTNYFPDWLSIAIGKWIVFAIPVFFVIRLISIFLLEVYKYWFEINKETVYGEAILILKSAFARIHKLKKETEPNLTSLNNVLSNVCQDIKLIFDNKTKGVCSVSIKLLVDIKEQPIANTKVRNVSRDKEAREKRNHNSYSETEHSIFNNTAYNVIYTKFEAANSDNLYYINDDIPKSVDYMNTSKGTYCPNGELPYKSEIVVPILPAINDGGNRYTLIGFLCVDCVNAKAFESKYDVGLLQGVADGMYDVILFHLS